MISSRYNQLEQHQTSIEPGSVIKNTNNACFKGSGHLKTGQYIKRKYLFKRQRQNDKEQEIKPI